MDGRPQAGGGLAQAGLFLGRLYDPSDDLLLSGPGDLASQELIDAGKRAVDYVEAGIADPSRVVDDVRKATRQLDVDTSPYATPMSDTLGGEMARRFNIAANRGALGWDVGTSIFGEAGLAAKAPWVLGLTGELTGPARFEAQGFQMLKAKYLAEKYNGIGHHFFPQRLSRQLGLPAWLADNPFFVFKPAMSQGEFYESHFINDPHVGGFRLPRRVGGVGRGSGWSGNAIGLQKNGVVGRLLQSSPAPLNTAAGAAGAAGLAKYRSAGDR